MLFIFILLPIMDMDNTQIQNSVNLICRQVCLKICQSHNILNAMSVRHKIIILIFQILGKRSYSSWHQWLPCCLSFLRLSTIRLAGLRSTYFPRQRRLNRFFYQNICNYWNGQNNNIINSIRSPVIIKYLLFAKNYRITEPSKVEYKLKNHEWGSILIGKVLTDIVDLPTIFIYWQVFFFQGPLN